MKIKKGDWFRCIKTTDRGIFKEGEYFQTVDDGRISVDEDDVYSGKTFIGCAGNHFQKLYTIQDLRNGKVAVVNDGTLEELKKVLDLSNPDDNFSIKGSYSIYECAGKYWGGVDRTNLPTQSVKDFLVQLPKEGVKQCANNEQRKDPINPEHYKSYSVETIDMMVAIYGKEKTAIHCELTAFKYRQRLGKKDSIEQDLEKEKWYLNKAKELRNDNSVTKL